MKHHQVYRPMRVNLFDLLIILWGCGMLPLWGVGLYSSFEEGPLVQSLVMPLTALVVAFCFIVAPLCSLRKGVAVLALLCTAGFTVAHIVYNAGTLALLIFGLGFALVFFWLPTILLFLSSLPRYHVRFFAAADMVVNARFWGILALAVAMLLVLIGGLYGFGLSF
ncbi:MAG: hypothetical protein NT075_25065 [Chloroflexi bacterium]|nr:hypothetical protein [Chloroflexota bacterium]